MQAVSPYQFFIFPSFNLVFTMFMQISFLLIYKKYFLLASSPHKQKNTEIYPLHSYTFPPENQLLHSLKRVLLPPHPPLPFPLSFSYIYSSNHLKTPYLQCFERKRTQKRTKKEEDICILKKKNYQKKT